MISKALRSQNIEFLTYAMNNYYYVTYRVMFIGIEMTYKEVELHKI